MKPGRVVIHLIRPRDGAPAGILTESELARAAAFRFPEDAARWASYRAALRRILGGALGMPPGDVPLALTEAGKPVLAAPHHGLHFSLSHCDDLALVALCADGTVGIDVEPLGRAVELAGCEPVFCHPEEILALPVAAEARHDALLDLWTAKEALLKALGTGLLHPPESIQIRLDEPVPSVRCDGPFPGIERQRLHRLAHPSLEGYRAFLSAPVPEIVFAAEEASTSSAASGMIRPQSDG